MKKNLNLICLNFSSWVDRTHQNQTKNFQSLGNNIDMAVMTGTG